MERLHRTGLCGSLSSQLTMQGALSPLWLLLSLAVCSAASAGVINPYHCIPERNVFGLKPPAPPQTTYVPSAPLPKITLTGITTLFGKRALLKVEFPAQINQPARHESMILAEGQRNDGIEILQVDEKTSRVRLNNSGTIMEVTFDKHLLANSLVTPAPPVRTRPAWARPPAPGWARRN